MARENRQFLGKAVTYVAGQGIGQFIDVGAGLPTAVNTHDVARQVDTGREGGLRGQRPGGVWLTPAGLLATSSRRDRAAR